MEKLNNVQFTVSSLIIYKYLIKANTAYIYLLNCDFNFQLNEYNMYKVSVMIRASYNKASYNKASNYMTSNLRLHLKFKSPDSLDL